MSLVFDTHKWRGFSTGSNLFDHEVTLGWLTIVMDRKSVPDRVRSLTNTVRDLGARIDRLRDSLKAERGE